MGRLAWLATILVVLGACRSGEPAMPLTTFAGPGEVEPADRPIWVEGTLERRSGCLVVALDADDDGRIVRAVLRLPDDGGAEPDWRDDRLWFHDESYALGSTLLFRATPSRTDDVDDVPGVCRETGLPMVVSADSRTTDLAMDRSATVIGQGDQPRVPVAELSSGGMLAAMRGDLAVVGGRCLGVEAPGTDTLLVWPYGTTVSYAPDPVVLLPDGTAYAVGDRLDLGGGYTSEPDTASEPSPAPIDGLPPECQQLGRFLVSPF